MNIELISVKESNKLQSDLFRDNFSK